MTRTKDELERLINGSELFSIDRSVGGDTFTVEERKLLTNLADYMKITRKDFDERGLEILATAKDCIKSYKAEKGAFLNYFNVALAKNVFVAEAKERAEEHRVGVSISDKKIELIRAVLKYRDTSGKNINDPDVQEEIANKLESQGVTFEMVREAVEINYNATVISGDSRETNDDGDDGNTLFDMIPADMESVDEGMVKIESLRKIVDRIDTAFIEQQDRTKPILKKLLTVRLIEAIDDVSLIERVAFERAFFDVEIYADYKANNKIPTARDIVGKDHEAGASRTLNNFLKKIRSKG